MGDFPYQYNIRKNPCEYIRINQNNSGTENVGFIPGDCALSTVQITFSKIELFECALHQKSSIITGNVVFAV